MDRYTKKDKFSVGRYNGSFVSVELPYLPIRKRDKGKILGEDAITNHAIDKLSALEDIEEEIGIDLLTLLKALIYGAWFKDCELRDAPVFYAKARLITLFEDDVTHAQDKSKVVGFRLLERLYGLGYELRDYGKTWALTKEELE